jgi:hypothetical protein
VSSWELKSEWKQFGVVAGHRKGFALKLKSFRTIAICAVLGTTGSTPVVAKEFRWTHYGPRPLAMGNAFVSVADDYNALFYNPAGLARLKDWNGEFLNLSAEISANTVSFISDASELASGSAGDLGAVLDLMRDQSGKNHHFALQMTPHLIFPGFGLGLALNLDTSMAFHSDISVDVKAGPSLIMPVSYARNFLGDRLSVGATVKVVAQGGIDREFSIQDIEAFTQEDTAAETDPSTADASEKKQLDDYVIGGYGLGVDMGMLFTPTEEMRPTIGLSVTDVGGTPYEEANVQGEALGTPATRLPSVNTGFSFRPIENAGSYLLVAVDAHAVNQPIHYSKKFNLGTEYGFGEIIKLQGGLYQGGLTAGFQFDVKLLKVRFATYQEQLGSVAGLHDNLADRRYLLQLKLLI